MSRPEPTDDEVVEQAREKGYELVEEQRDGVTWWRWLDRTGSFQPGGPDRDGTIATMRVRLRLMAVRGYEP